MISPKVSIQSDVLTRITPEKLNRPKFIQYFGNLELNHGIGRVYTTVKTDFVDLDQTGAWKQASSSLLNALTPHPISAATRTSSTTQPNVELSVNTTHITMTSNMISALMEDKSKDEHAAHNRIMVLILIGIFMFISLLITMVVVVMCKKKNSVFMLQKCEQGSDLELGEIEEINTELDTSESEYEPLDSNIDRKRSESYPCLGKLKYMEECYTEAENLWKSVDQDLQRKTQKNVDSESPSSTPLLFNKNSGTGSSEFTLDVVTGGNSSGHSLDKLTGSVSSDKFVICLDKYSIHSQQHSDSDQKQLRSSHRRPRVTKSRTFDASLRSRHSYSCQEIPAKREKTTKRAKDRLFKGGANVFKCDNDPRTSDQTFLHSKDRQQVQLQDLQNDL